ncbi:MAG: nuclear transport factor 2 family protein [Anaerolineales bacterium]|nr:nuclear transport factor 2 family protein [Anaerolineales bacterium]MCK5315943.1 nuclear transport factor 2 family protein [Anaerolineales bacterium]
MSNKLEIVNAYAKAAASWADNAEAAEACLADDFHTVDKDGKVVLSKEGFVGMGRMMVGSFPDFGFVTTDIRMEGSHVIFTGHNEGTHVSDLDLSAMGVGVVPASGKKIVWPEASMKLTVEGNRIAKMEPYGGAAGLQGFLSALGVDLPSE